MTGRRGAGSKFAEDDGTESLENAFDVFFGELGMDAGDVDSIVVLRFFLNLVDYLLLKEKFGFKIWHIFA